jgi:hypothetical protein
VGDSILADGVRILRPVSEAEVVAAFLRGELASARWREGLLELLGEEVSPVTTPNLNDEEENAYRARLLDRHRGWLRREGLFNGLPERIDWCRAGLTPEEVLAIRYIDWDWWLRVSGGNRSPLDAARRIRAGLVPGGNAEWHEPIAARLASADPPAELIAVGPPDRSRLVVMEGHVRLTAYALYPAHLPDELEIYLGTSAEIDRWSEF